MGTYTKQQCLDEIQIVSQATNDIKNAIVGKGVEVPSDTPLSDYAELIESIPSGGGLSSATIPIINLEYPESVEECGTFAISGLEQQLKTAYDSDICYLSNDDFDYDIPVGSKYESDPDEAGRVQYGMQFDTEQFYYYISFWTDGEGDVMNISGYPIIYEIGYQNTNYMEANITPTTESQEVYPDDGTLWFNKVNVSAVDSSIDSNIQAGNIKKGVSILGTTGTYEGSGGSGFEINETNGIKLGGSVFTTIPEGITFNSNITGWNNMFNGCIKLSNVPDIDTSNGTSFAQMFYCCNNLKSIPSLNTSKGTDFRNMFQSCNNLSDVPALDTSKGTNFNFMFSSCSLLTSIPALDTSKGTSFISMFAANSRLETIEGIDFSGLTSNQISASYMFSTPNVISSITVNGYINYTMNFSYLTKLYFASVKSILQAASRTTNTNAKTLTFALSMTDHEGELAALVSDCTSKGWTIVGLTIE